MPNNNPSSLRILFAGAMIPAAVYGSTIGQELTHKTLSKNVLEYILNYSSTESNTKVYNQDLLDMAKIDLENAGLDIVGINNYIEYDNDFGEMTVVNVSVKSDSITPEKIVSLNMEIINKYSLFENNIIFMVYIA